MSDAAILIIVAAVTSVLTVSAGAVVGRLFGLGPLAKESASQKSEIIEDLKTRLELAEGDVAKANAKADATEERRLDCEEEIGRLRADVRSLEREVLAFHRRTGTPAPRTLIKREAEHRREDREYREEPH